MHIPHSFVNGHLDHFHLFALVNMLQRTLTYTYVLSPCFSILWSVCLGGELLGHVAILFLAFWWITKLLFTMAPPFTHPSEMNKDFKFLHVLRNSCCSLLLFRFLQMITIGILVHMKWYLIVLFIVFSSQLILLNIFSIIDLLHICISSLEQCLFKFFAF